MIAESDFATVFGAPVAGGDDSLAHLARAAVRSGFAIVVNRPGTKQPMCTLNTREVKQADGAARAEAYDAGNRRWDTVRHACGVHHAITDDKVADRVVKRLVRNHGRINLGVELHRSRVVVVDVDTEAENAAFRQAWIEATGELPGDYTVATPGVEGDDPENWKHKHGGHYWFLVPEGITLPRADGVYKDPSGWTMMWADRQVLVPPSTRPEGVYRLVGEPQTIPKWLLVKLLSYCLERKRAREEQEKRRAARVASGDETAAIDVWSTDTPWADLLEPDGWYDTTVPDNCGCPIWTAPGVHASPKSATAHDVGCARYDDSPGHAPLHIWTDNPPDWLDPALGKTFTKIQYLANRDHAGNVAAACRSVDIAREGGQASELAALGVGNAALMQVALGTNGSVPDDPLPVPSGASGTALTPLGSPTNPPTPETRSTAPMTNGNAQEEARARAVAEELWKLEIREEARAALKVKQLASAEEPPPLMRGDDFLAQEDEGEDWLLESVWPADGNIFLAAQRKSGKTTLTGNLLRSFCDEDPFLGRYMVRHPPEMTVVVDLEMSARKLRSWTRDQQIKRPERFAVEALRGSVSTFNIFDDKVRTSWARKFADVGMQVFILDCLRPLMDAFNLDENHQIGQVTLAVDELVKEAGAANALIVHHAGHAGDRSRGDSRARDWPDAEWFLARTSEDDRSPREFWTYGRDVDTPAEVLVFDHATKRLSLADPLASAVSGVAQPGRSRIVDDIVALLKEQMSSLNGSQIKAALRGRHGLNAIDKALVDFSGTVFRREAQGRGIFYSLIDGPTNPYDEGEKPGLGTFLKDNFETPET